MFCVLLAAVALTVALIAPAHAYLDPGTASLILQGIIGAVVAAGIAFRSYLSKFVSFFWKKPDATRAAETQDKVRSETD